MKDLISNIDLVLILALASIDSRMPGSGNSPTAKRIPRNRLDAISEIGLRHPEMAIFTISKRRFKGLGV